MFLKQNGDAAVAVVAELTQTSATSKGQACSNLTFPARYGNTVPTIGWGTQTKHILLAKQAQNPVLHNGSLTAKPNEDCLHGNASSNKVSPPPFPQSYL